MKSFMKLLAAILCIYVFCANDAARAQSQGTPWRAVDALGRRVEAGDQNGALREGKKVGIFYFLWLDESVPKAPWNDGPYDLTKILEKLPESDLKDIELSKSDLWAGPGVMHFWGEPLFGYYVSRDPWVIRRHMQLLVDAGVDFLVFDTTNNVTYPKVVAAICDVMLQMRAEGATTPQITFMINTNAAQTAEKLWNEVYSKEQYADLILQLDGKPLLVGDPNVIANETIKEKLTLRRAHWPFTMVNTENAWHWEAAYPQPYGWSKDPNKAEQVNVSVAQNLSRAPDAHVANMSSGEARGRSFCDGRQEEDLATDLGRNFAEQWKRAYELDPDFVMITGWNEWIAGRWPRGDRNVFVDQYNREYSRDIEPMKGGHHDNYYLQMIQGIRKYKGVAPLPSADAPKTIDLNGDVAQWNNVKLTFSDWIGETAKRDFPGCGKTHYVNETGRNDFVSFKAARDDDAFYFYAKTAAPISEARPNGLCLLINSDDDLKTGFIGGDVLIGAKYDQSYANVATFAGKKTDQWKWKSSDKVEYKLAGNEIMFKVPYSILGQTRDQASFNRIGFKWLDDFGSKEIEVDDVYVRGDVAPESRFFFQATE